MTPILHLLNHQDNSVILSISGARWEYILPSRPHLDSFEYLYNKVSPLKALNYAKKQAIRAKKVEATHG